MNFSVVLKVLSRNLFIIGFALLICVIVALIYSEAVFSFEVSSLIAFILGLTLYLINRRQREKVVVKKKEAYLAVTLSWVLMALIGCLPFIISGSIPSFTDAFFESISGFTTTGSSILTDIEILPKSIIFWRSLTHWVGGIGIIVLVIVVMPTLHMGGYNLFTLESSLQEKIQPKVRKVGTQLLIIYLTLSFAEVVLLMAGGMNLFESLCHTFGTIATGGFSPKNTSIMDYSPYIQYVIMIFMLLAGTNFVIHYYLVKGRFNKIKQNEELKFYLLMVFVIGALITAGLVVKTDKSLEEAFRDSFFQVISVITCTGFASADYMLWPHYAIFIIFFAMFLGGSTGSTAGGIKMARHLLLFKNIDRKFKRLMAPKAVFSIRLNHTVVDEDTNSSILSFVTFYVLIFITGSFLMVLSGVKIQEATSSVATCMAGIGPGLGAVGPAGNFAYLPVISKLILSFLMLLGRLEIYTLLMLFTPSFWKK